MRFSLQDVKKSVQRRHGELTVSLHFLQPGELSIEIGELIAYYERLLGQAQRCFSLDDARAFIGDYRLAHCLLAALSNWYNWRQRDWGEVVQEISNEKSVPELAAISSPVQLRLALYNYVNEHYQGFLDARTRPVALQQFADMHSLDMRDLEYLLALDSDEEMRLVRDTLQAPTPQEVATLYNQWTFEAALFNASDVHFRIDCNAFGSISDGAQFLIPSVGMGAVIKRLCYLARKMGVYYDLAYEPTLEGMPTLLSLTLYGPQEVSGAPQYYGMRLARLCRSLMGYGIARSESGRRAKQFKPSLSSAILEASATVHFLQRSYAFFMDADLLRLLPAVETSQERKEDGVRVESSHLFDSSIEQSFADAFTALAKSDATDGWRLEREPEPLLLDSSIFIPDFALTRAQRRIYVEILGFWTPSYRERKIQKLQQLQGRNDLLLAIPIEAKDAFASITPYFPTVFYDGQLSASEVLTVLRNRYDDFAERLARIDVDAVRERVRRKGMLSERTCAEVLHCYRRSEVQRAVEAVTGKDVVFLSGVGLYSSAWMQQVKQSFIEWMSSERSTLLANALHFLREHEAVLGECEDTTLEALVSMWPEISIHRSSIFDAMVAFGDASSSNEEQRNLASEAGDGRRPSISSKDTKRREKRVAARKRMVHETAQGDLWG